MSEQSKCPTCRQPVVRAEIRTIGGNFESWHYEPVVSESQAQTPLQAAAIAALMRWRKVGLAFDRTSFDSWPDWHEQWEAAEEALRTTADALIAADGGTG